MTDTPRMIVWMKWRDPLGRNQGEFEYVPEKDVEHYDNDQTAVYDTGDDEEIDSEGPTPVVITPMGILPLKPFNDPTKVFNFWLGETNFNISRKVAYSINSIPGVEILDVFTRYKFRIAVGNNFKFQNVRQAIEKVLNAEPPSTKEKSENMVLDNNTKTQIQQIIQAQLAKFPYWAIYVCPNGQIDMSASHEKSIEFDDRIDVYLNARRLAGGAIFKYDEQLV